MNKCMTILLLSAITMSTVQEVYSKINDPSKNESIEPKSRNLRSNAYQIKMYWERGMAWQETYKEWQWCAECEEDDCPSGGYAVIKVRRRILYQAPKLYYFRSVHNW